MLKKDILDLSNEPIALNYGVIGKLEVRIPWLSMGVDPVVIIIDSIYLLLEPKYNWNQEARNKREQKNKDTKLAADELFSDRSSTNDPLQGYKDIAQKWLMEAIFIKMIPKH